MRFCSFHVHILASIMLKITPSVLTQRHSLSKRVISKQTLLSTGDKQRSHCRPCVWVKGDISNTKPSVVNQSKRASCIELHAPLPSCAMPLTHKLLCSNGILFMNK